MDAALKLSFNPQFEPISLEDALCLEGYKHAAHCFIYALNSGVIEEKYPARAAVLMQMRSDGTIGFPGGFADKGGDLASELNRELKEEINLDSEHFKVLNEHYAISHQCKDKNLCVHFYEYRVSMEEFQCIERDIFSAEDYGNENFGIIRVPLFTMDDGIRGLPSFLRNNFIGNARDQLLTALAYTKLMTVEELCDAIKKSKESN